MDLSLTDEDAELVRSFSAFFARESSPGRARAAEELGFDPDLWAALNGLGVPELATGPEAASLEQLALIAEQAGRHLASAPIVETVVAHRLLDRCDSPAARELLDALPAGAIVTLALHPVTGTTAPLVPAGAVAGLVLWFDGERLLATTDPAPGRAIRNLGSLPLADRDLGSGQQRVVATGADAADAFCAARQEWQLLTASQLVGLSARALELGVAYARDRVIFHRPVATFQTVAHTLADLATAVDGARLLVQEAAWTADLQRDRRAALATMAFCFAGENAVRVAGDCLHFHGGYGFTLEYDIQLYYRRAKAYSLVWGGIGKEYQRLADQLFGTVAPAELVTA